MSARFEPCAHDEFWGPDSFPVRFAAETSADDPELPTTHPKAPTPVIRECWDAIGAHLPEPTEARNTMSTTSPRGKQAECAACHRLFSSTSTFDQHRYWHPDDSEGVSNRRRLCHDEAWLIEHNITLRNGAWSSPPMSDADIDKMRARRATPADMTTTHEQED